MSVAIRVENLSKAYQIGQIGTGTISRDVERWFVTRVMGREDPFLKLGEVNDRTTKSESNVVWSLKDINLEIGQGDSLGIIGRNGAGKSTLLKLLSRVTAPTTGIIKIKGRVASLLEVGTGFHPELTGRENIYLNGSILGMRKREIDRKLDEIVDFSGVERYIDTPVKRYSSGMSVRLAFAVAAHLESEILIVDEVLAVGDAEFQKKCLGKMSDVTTNDGRTILFVSHNMAAVSNLCSRVISLKDGRLWADGTPEIISDYLNSVTLDTPRNLQNRTDIRPSQILWATDFWFAEKLGRPITVARTGQPLIINICYKTRTRNAKRPEVQLGFYDMFDQNVAACDSRISASNLGARSSAHEGIIRCFLPKLPLRPGIYKLNIRLGLNGEWFDHIVSVAQLHVEHGDFYGTGRLLDGNRAGVLMEYSWEFECKGEAMQQVV